jgi:hypothetical protein
MARARHTRARVLNQIFEVLSPGEEDEDDEEGKSVWFRRST